MPGARTIGETCYCFVPQSRAESRAETYWENGPSLSADFDRSARKFKKPDGSGFYPRQHYLLFEDELLVAPSPTGHYRVWRFPGSEVWPVNTAAIRSAAAVESDGNRSAVVRQLLSSVRLSYTTTTVEIQVAWEGLIAKRVYELATAKLSALIWPPKPFHDWGPYFIGIGPARPDEDPELPSPSNLSIRGQSLSVDSLKTTEIICSQNMRALLQFDRTPEMLEFYWNGVAAGIVPLAVTGQDFAISPAPERKNHPPNLLATYPSLPNSGDECDLSFDFGTTNSAVAFRKGKAAPELLSLRGCGSVSLTRFLRFSVQSNEKTGATETMDVDGVLGRDELMRFFFPSEDAVRNPLPTLVFDNPSFANSEDGWAFPRRALALTSTTRPLLDAARSEFLLQNFKWRFDQPAKEAKRAFLQMVTFLSSWRLRLDGIRRVKTVFITAPLAFSDEQQETTNEFFDIVNPVLELVGLGPEPGSMFISESYANVCFAAKGGAGGHAAPGESEVLVVVDIGGGTSDIGVFKWKGDEDPPEALWLDSLRIGGMDFVRGSPATTDRLSTPGIVESFAAKRNLSRLAWPGAIKPSLFDRSDAPMEPQHLWPDLFGLAFPDLLRTGDGREKTATELGREGLTSRLLTLLCFAAAYGVLLAGGDKEPEVTLWLSGLGAGFLDLSPILRVGEPSRRKQAEKAIERIAGAALKRDVRVSFASRPLGKEAVSRGALYCDAGTPFERRSICWSKLEKSWKWTTRFDDSHRKRAAGQTHAIEVQPLLSLVSACANEFKSDATELSKLLVEVETDYKRAIAGSEYDYPSDAVVAALKSFAARGRYTKK